MYMRFCPSCGKENTNNGKFCSSCGRNLEENYGASGGVRIENADERFQIWNGCLQKYVGRDRTVTVPVNVVTIDVKAFRDCTTIERLIIPDTVQGFRECCGLRYAFTGCTNLKYIEFGGGIKKLDCMVLGAKNIETIIVKEGVEELGKDCFLGAENLTKISLPNTLKKIGDHSLANCERLTDIVIPDSVSEIGSWAFASDFALKNVLMGNSVRIFGEGVFSRCTGIREFRFPNTDFYLEEEGRNLFRDCKYLEKIYCPARMFNAVRTMLDYNELHRDLLGNGEGVKVIQY